MRQIVVVLAIVLATGIFSGCETLKGAGRGMVRDVQNIPDPDKNGYNALKRADAWLQQTMW